jgi:purine nucleosidase
VRAHPHEVTIYAAGPLTNIALAIAIDPEFASLTKGIALMGGSLNPQTDDPEFAGQPAPRVQFLVRSRGRAYCAARRLAAHRRDHGGCVDQGAVHAADAGCHREVAHAAARYIAAWSQDRYYMWDELAACAWLDPS